MSGALGPGAFILGAFQLSLTLGCAMASAALIVRRRLSWLMGAPRGVALAILTIAATLLAELVPLTLGVLARATVPIAAALVLLGCSRIRPSSQQSLLDPALVGPGPEPLRLRPSPSWILAGIGLLATLCAWLAFLQVAVTMHVTSVDALGFHFPGVIRFIQTGSLWQTTQYLPGQAQGNYPQYGDLLLLAVALPWHSLAFVRYVDPVLLAIAALATYAIGRELRASAPAAALAALALVSIRPTLGPALPDVLTDPGFLAGFAGGALFLTRHWRTGARDELVLAGLGLGIAFGTKWYGLGNVPLLVAAWTLASAASRRRRAFAARDAGVLVAVTALAGGIWLVRNLILTGNPVFDYKVSLFGATIFRAPPDPIRAHIGFTLAHYIGDWGVLRHYIWPVFRSDFGLAGALIGAGALVAGGLCALARRRRERSSPVADPRVVVLLAGALMAAIAYLITPYTAQGVSGAPVLVDANTRYAAPALVLAAPLLALTASRVRGGRLLIEAALLACVLDGLHRYIPTGAGRLVTTGALVVVFAAAFTARRAVRHGGVRRTIRQGERSGSRRRLPALGLAAIVGCVLLGVAYHFQRVLAVEPWTPEEPTIEYVLAHDSAHTRIAVAGTWLAQGLVPVAPLFGPRFQNTVTYVGPFVEHRLEQYASPGPFISALRRGHYRLLELGTGFPPAADPIQYAWARRAGYVYVTRSARLILMRATSTTGLR